MLTLIKGNCFEILPELDKVDYCLSSPPFKEGELIHPSRKEYWDAYDELIDLLSLKTKCALLFQSSTKMREMFRRYEYITRVLIWGKAPSCYSYRYEPIFVFVFDKTFKINKYLFKDYWQESPVKNNGGTYENPVKLYKEILLKFPRGIVLDPFHGTGTTEKACKELNLNYIGISMEASP
jgi:hypothetical protein